MTLMYSPRDLGNGQLAALVSPGVGPDEIHLFLKVTDRLITALIQTARSYDKHKHRISCTRRAYKVLEGPLVTNLIAAIRSCGIYSTMYEDEETGKLNSRL